MADDIKIQPSIANPPRKERLIKIKQADGSVVRMTLEEFQKSKSAPTVVAQKNITVNTVASESLVAEEGLTKDLAVIEKKPILVPVPPPKPSLEMSEAQKLMAAAKAQKEQAGKERLAKRGKVPDISTANDWDADDHKSLLDEDFHSEDLHKEIQEKRDLLARVRPTKNIDIKEPLAITKTVPLGKTRPVGLPGVAVFKAVPASLPSLPDSLLKNNNQVRSGFSDSSTASALPQPSKMAGKPFVLPARPLSIQPKNIVRDVTTAPRRMATGPVEELGAFSLVELRRLAPTTAEAKAKVLQKFNTLKKESYLFYMDGVEAWYGSPLYSQYKQIIQRSLQGEGKVPELLGEGGAKDSFTLDDFHTMVEINKTFI